MCSFLSSSVRTARAVPGLPVSSREQLCVWALEQRRRWAPSWSSSQEVDDVVSEVFVRILAMPRMPEATTTAGLLAWLRRVAARVAIDAHRREQRRPKGAVGHDGDAVDPAEVSVRWSPSIGEHSFRLVHLAEAHQEVAFEFWLRVRVAYRVAPPGLRLGIEDVLRWSSPVAGQRASDAARARRLRALEYLRGVLCDIDPGADAANGSDASDPSDGQGQGRGWSPDRAEAPRRTAA